MINEWKLFIAVFVFCVAAIAAVSIIANRASYDPVLDSGSVNLVGQANDGTKLFEQSVGGHRVYFSHSGTSWTTEESCGKGCVRTIPHSVPSNGGISQ